LPALPKAGVPAKVPSLPKDTPEGRPPVFVRLIGASPVAVTEKVPAVFSAKEVDAAEVKTGTDAATVSVNDWVAVFELASVAVMVIG
jgi:hypothetical protein